MTANQLIARLQDEIAKRPETGDQQILIIRDNGKRTFRTHRIESFGWRKLTDQNPWGHVAISLGFDGNKF